MEVLVLITGLPGSGKSSLAVALAERLAFPLIAKDRYKEILFDTLGVKDAAWSRQLGAAAVALQYEAMRTIRHAIVDSALWTDLSEPQVESLQLPLVQLYCSCPFEMARERFFLRAQRAERHRGFDAEQMTVEDYERFRPLTEPLCLSWPLVRVDTSEPVDVDEVASLVVAADPSRQ